MAIGGGFLPQGINFRLAGFIHYFGKARCFNFEKFHIQPIRENSSKGSAAIPALAPITKSPPENYGREDQTTVAAFLLWRGS